MSLGAISKNAYDLQKITISGTAESSPQTTDALQPLMQQLIDEVNSATSNVSSLSTRSIELDKRQLDEAVGAVVADIITVCPSLIC